MTQAIDDQTNRGIILKILAGIKRCERPAPRRYSLSCRPRRVGPCSHHNTTLSTLRLVLAGSVTA